MKTTQMTPSQLEKKRKSDRLRKQRQRAADRDRYLEARKPHDEKYREAHAEERRRAASARYYRMKGDAQDG